MRYEDLDGCKFGQITVPDEMVSDMGWEVIERQVINTFKTFIPFQSDDSKAWRLAVWNVYASWQGVHNLAGQIRRDEVFAV